MTRRRWPRCRTRRTRREVLRVWMGPRSRGRGPPKLGVGLSGKLTERPRMNLDNYDDHEHLPPRRNRLRSPQSGVGLYRIWEESRAAYSGDFLEAARGLRGLQAARTVFTAAPSSHTTTSKESGLRIGVAHICMPL